LYQFAERGKGRMDRKPPLELIEGAHRIDTVTE
jgi:hypothetical protein